MLQKSPTLTPSLENLSYILRHRELWPDGFRWDFRSRHTCAIEMCEMLWGMGPGSLHKGLLDSELTYEKNYHYNRIFTMPRWGWLGLLVFPLTMRLVTPEVVANRIDRFLAKHGG